MSISHLLPMYDRIDLQWQWRRARNQQPCVIKRPLLYFLTCSKIVLLYIGKRISLLHIGKWGRESYGDESQNDNDGAHFARFQLWHVNLCPFQKAYTGEETSTSAKIFLEGCLSRTFIVPSDPLLTAHAASVCNLREGRSHYRTSQRAVR